MPFFVKPNLVIKQDEIYFYQKFHWKAVGWQTLHPRIAIFTGYKRRSTAIGTAISAVSVHLHCKCIPLDAVHNALILRFYCACSAIIPVEV